jgi:hypothetical protein
LVSLARDTSVVALADYPAVLTLARDEGLAPPTIERLCEFVLAPPLVPTEFAAAVRDHYSAASIAACYADLLESQR